MIKKKKVKAWKFDVCRFPENALKQQDSASNKQWIIRYHDDTY